MNCAAQQFEDARRAPPAAASPTWAIRLHPRVKARLEEMDIGELRAVLAGIADGRVPLRRPRRAPRATTRRPLKVAKVGGLYILDSRNFRVLRGTVRNVEVVNGGR